MNDFDTKQQARDLRAERILLAGMAMQTLIADEALVTRESVVRVAIEYADLMLNELKRRPL